MDEELSSKFIWSLSKFLRSLCNGYVDFDDGVELIGHIYLNVDGGKTGRKLNYFLNERVYKNDTLITFISNSFHAQPEYKGEGKEGDGKKNEEAGGASESVSRSAVPSNKYQADIQAGSKRPGSPLSAPTPPTQRRMQSSKVKGPVGSPAKIVPSSASSSSQDNDPSPWQESKNGSEISGPASNQSNNATADNENNSVPPNVETINHLPDLASFLDTMTGDDQSSQDQRSLPGVKPDIDNDFDLTHVKQESVSEPSSCAQAGSAEQAETPEQEHVTAEIKREVDMTDAMPNISQPTCQPQDSSWVKSEFHIKIEAPEEVPHPIEHRTQNPGHISDGICPEWPAATNRHISSDIHPESDAISTVTMSTAKTPLRLDGLCHLPVAAASKEAACVVCNAKHRKYAHIHKGVRYADNPFKRRKSSMKCGTCNAVLCCNPSSTCFRDYHTKDNYID